MSKTLTLHPRRHGADGQPLWHDTFTLARALEEIAKGKALGKMAVFLKIAGKLQLAEEAAGLSPGNFLMPITIELRNSEARIMWREIENLKPEQYDRNQMGQPAVPPLGPLNAMLESIAEQLGESLPEPDEDKD